MKNLTLSIALILFFINSILFAQMDTIWYDANWKDSDKSKAMYYRPEAQKKGNLFLHIDYYVSGSKQMEAYSHDKNLANYEGEVVWFFENGTIFQIVHYKKGVLNGKRQVYYPNGKQNNEVSYVDGKQQGIWLAYYKNGKIKEQGSYENNQKEGPWKSYYEDGSLKSEGQYVFDNKIDTWKTYYYDGMKEKE